MRNIVFVIIFLIPCLTVNAQTLQVKDLSNSIGLWVGTLTYLDYSSGKPYTMLSNIKIDITADNVGYLMGFEYPKEPQANSMDTIRIHGNYFGRDKIIEFKKYKNSGFKLVTELEGVDGNEHKNAILRHTYLVRSNNYSIIKDVKFEGTDKWIKRNEYSLKKADK